jgi:hypothetical protein
MAAHGERPPAPLECNRVAWDAFVRVRYCRHVSMAGEWMPAWADIAAVLQLHDQWTPETQVKLSVCFMELLALEAENRKANG